MSEIQLMPVSAFAELKPVDQLRVATSLADAVHASLPMLKANYPGPLNRYSEVEAGMGHLGRSARDMAAGKLDAHLLVEDGLEAVGIATFMRTSPQLASYEGVCGLINQLHNPNLMRLYRELGCNVTFWSVGDAIDPSAAVVADEAARRMSEDEILSYTLISEAEAVRAPLERDPAARLSSYGFQKTPLKGRSRLVSSNIYHRVYSLAKD